VRNPANGREVVVRVNDRGPFHSDRVIDLSYTAALKLGLLGGVAPVELERITQESIRTGAWRGQATDTRLAALLPAVPELADPIAEIARRVAREPDPPAASPGPTRARADPLPARGDAAALPVAAAAAAPTPVAADATLAAVPGFWLQFGAFSQRDGALDLHQKLLRQAGWLAPLLAIFDDQRLHRVQAGPYASRADARSAAEQLRDALRQLPAIVERR
jgi:rare lipoprotein A